LPGPLGRILQAKTNQRDDTKKGKDFHIATFLAVWFLNEETNL